MLSMVALGFGPLTPSRSLLMPFTLWATAVRIGYIHDTTNRSNP
jgi:hypothetical protein